MEDHKIELKQVEYPVLLFGINIETERNMRLEGKIGSVLIIS